jgi:hypothetical protein
MEAGTSARLLRASEVAQMIGVDPKTVETSRHEASFRACGSVARAGIGSEERTSSG